MTIGPKQRPIIEALKAGGVLWMLRTVVSSLYPQNRERCMGLYVRGFIMHDGEVAHGWAIYRITEKGRKA